MTHHSNGPVTINTEPLEQMGRAEFVAIMKLCFDGRLALIGHEISDVYAQLIEHDLAQRQRIADLESMLGELEWRGRHSYFRACCPECGGEYGNDEHKADCRLARLLRKED